jgi:hypothetical protein
MRIKTTAAVVFGLGAIALWSWGTVTAQSQQPASGGCDVAAELRLLREIVEANGKTQALSSYAALQQSRIQPLTAELLATRKQLDEATLTLRSVRAHLQDFQPTGNSSADVAIRTTQVEAVKNAETREAMLRAREGELSTKLQNEEAIWQQLMAQLQQVIKR